MKIRLLVGFRGRETGEHFYEAGSVVELPDEVARRLVGHRQAEPVVPEAELVAIAEAVSTETSGPPPEPIVPEDAYLGPQVEASETETLPKRRGHKR